MITETKDDILSFIRESNKIEGIIREPLNTEISEYERFIKLKKLTIDEISTFVSVYQPDAELRMHSHLNVRVGNHIPRTGGMGVVHELDNILELANGGEHPYRVHHLYEILHPYTDGNGRSGRMIWKWQMAQRGTRAPLGFLHTFYYQSLEIGREL